MVRSAVRCKSAAHPLGGRRSNARNRLAPWKSSASPCHVGMQIPGERCRSPMVAQKSEMSSIPDILTARAPFLTLALCRVRQKLRARDEDAARRKMTTPSRHSGRIDPIKLSATPFCQIDRAEIGGSRISNESVAIGAIAIMNDIAWCVTRSGGPNAD